MMCQQMISSLIFVVTLKNRLKLIPSSIKHLIFHLPSYIKHQPSSMNKERFHNALALLLGYKRIINGDVVRISIDDKINPNDSKITIRNIRNQDTISFMASEATCVDSMMDSSEEVKAEVMFIVDSAHQAYIQATTNTF